MQSLKEDAVGGWLQSQMEPCEAEQGAQLHGPEELLAFLKAQSARALKPGTGSTCAGHQG